MPSIAEQIQESINVKQGLLRTHLPVLEKAAQILTQSYLGGGKALFFGNGGSASDSQHLAAEFVGRYEIERNALPAIALTTDTSILTAVGNDYGFDSIFERQVLALGKKGDVAFGLSTSGNSENVIRGVRAAKSLGIYTIGFLGRDGGKLASLVDLAITIPTAKTARIQEAHIMIGHILCQVIDEAYSKQNRS